MRLLVSILLLGTVLSAQAVLTNADVVRLVDSGLSEDFVLNMVNTRESSFSSDVSGLIELKSKGVSEKIVAAMVAKGKSQEPFTSDSVQALAGAGFSDDFMVEMIRSQPGSYATDAKRVVELKKAGVGEAVLNAMMQKGGSQQTAGPAIALPAPAEESAPRREAAHAVQIPAGTEVPVRLIDAIDSQKANVGDQFKASVANDVVIGGNAVIQLGADAVLRLINERNAGLVTGANQLTVELASLSIGGKVVPIKSSAVTEAGQGKGVKTAKRAAILGGVGAVIGAIAGGGTGAAIGAGAGGAAGAGSVMLTKGDKVKIPSETILTFRLAELVQP